MLKCLSIDCHSEHSEESLSGLFNNQRTEILHFIQDDSWTFVIGI